MCVRYTHKRLVSVYDHVSFSIAVLSALTDSECQIKTGIYTIDENKSGLSLRLNC